VLIEELIRKEKVKLHFHREGMIIGKGASSTDILRWDFSGAKSYGKLYLHNYTPLISKELFGRCERVRLGSSRATMMRYFIWRNRLYSGG
jgi:hypothetical protein